jgi:bacterioferritin-associated ferredoxin
MKIALASTAALLLLAGSAFAADVKVSGIHNCCPGCTNVLKSALTGAGATDIKTTETEVSFSAEDPVKAVKALYDAGFAGKKIDGAKAPEPENVKGVKTKSLKLTGVHNCCGSCLKGIQNATKATGTIDLKPKETTFTLSSDKEFDAEAAVKALRDAGYNAKVAK